MNPKTMLAPVNSAGMQVPQKKFQPPAAALEKTLGARQEQVRERITGRFSPFGFFISVELGRAPAQPFFVFDRKKLEKGDEHFLNNPHEPGVEMLLLDPKTLKCYSYFALCEEGTAKRAALARKGAQSPEDALKGMKGVLHHGAYPYGEVYRMEKHEGKNLALVGFDGKPQGERLEHKECLYVLVDTHDLPKGKNAETFVEETVRAAASDLL